MNILMALSQLEVTGAEVYATSVGNELTRRGHQVFYVSDTLTKPHNGSFFKLRFNKRSIPRRFWHVAYLVYLIKKHQIQLVHAHSRASSWSCHIACSLTNTPMVTTVHGRQPVHASRKKFHAMGDKALPVCEAIRDQLINELNVPESQLHVSRNGIETDTFKRSAAPNNHKPVISIIGRLSGPKGELCYRLLTECLDLDRYQVQVITGTPLTERFSALQDKVSFPGYSANVEQVMAQSDLVIGAGRVAMEALLCGRPTLAIGEASCVGIIELDNLNQAMATNFGDIGPRDLAIDFQQIPALIEQGLSQPHCAQEITEQIKLNYDLQVIVDELESLYQTVYVNKLQREVPIIMYHRFIRDDSEKGVHGTYLHIQQLEKHFQLLKKMDFETLTFKDLSEKGFIHRLQPGKRFIMITVDDGYRDNYELLLPLLKKYQFKAVVYVVTGENFNRWDVEVSDNPEKVVPLMSPEQVKALHNSGLVEIGGHTMTHPFLSKLSESEQREEILRNKLELEELIDESLTSFAYPYGDHNETSKRLAQELGYTFAVATNSGPLLMHQAPHQIRRIAIFPRTDSFGLWRKVKGDYLFKKINKK
ncbi:polysaccharide deacetylase family protein [Vibrio mimicus]|uniref:polysaccharide deacetylase family protein n=1 Tax=Vibrio mimicus TaxID=674 RepID=UPI0001BACC40|nr:polysaccharide deacetylase family protein [Vibrio mimicus]EEY46420.1 polysaccharide deacetylase [Vibrio mimicus VM223]